MRTSAEAKADSVRLLRKLALIERSVEAALTEQGVVRALLGDAPVLHDQNDIGTLNGGETVSDDEARAPLHHLSEGDRKSTRLNSSHWNKSRMPSSA